MCVAEVEGRQDVKRSKWKFEIVQQRTAFLRFCKPHKVVLKFREGADCVEGARDVGPVIRVVNAAQRAVGDKHLVHLRRAGMIPVGMGAHWHRAGT